MMHMRITPAATPEPPVRYGQRRLNPLALALAAGLHVGLLVLLLTFRGPLTEVVRQPRVIVYDVKLEPPPPPPEAQPNRPVTEPSPAAVHVPRPPIALPLPPPAIATTEEPLPPAQPVAEAGPKVAPAPAPAPPPPVAGGDLSSSMIHAPPPRYPHESRRKREQGTVVLTVLLATDGSVTDVRVARSSGYARLDEAARKAVRNWRWSPMLRAGVAVEVRGTVEIPFVLTG
ncbi:MAG: energy transducer TonB [Novosphingobium sp.]